MHMNQATVAQCRKWFSASPLFRPYSGVRSVGNFLTTGKHGPPMATALRLSDRIGVVAAQSSPRRNLVGAGSPRGLRSRSCRTAVQI